MPKGRPYYQKKGKQSGQKKGKNRKAPKALMPATMYVNRSPRKVSV